MTSMSCRSILSQKSIFVVVSGIAALLLSQGRTAHSRFKIPIDLKPNSVCSISIQSDLAEMLRRTKLILWDEAPMMNKFGFQSVDRTLRDVTNKPDIPFVPKGLLPDIVAASIKESYIWSCVQVCKLRQNMRAANAERQADLGNLTFPDWLLVLGDDRLEKVDNEHIRFPASMVICNQTLSGLINAVYGTAAVVARDVRQDYFNSRAILAAHNDTVDEINTAVLHRVQGEVHEYLIADKMDDEKGANMVPTEYLN